MNRLGFTSLLFLAGTSLSLIAGDRGASNAFQVGLVGSFPLSNFKDRTGSSGLGISAGWGFWKMSADSTANTFLEYRTYSANSGHATLADLGFDIQWKIQGGFYTRLGLSAERIHQPNANDTTKLGGIFGFGYRSKGSVGAEVYETHLASSNPSATTLNIAVTWSF